MAMVPWRKRGSWDPIENLDKLHQELNNLFNLSSMPGSRRSLMEGHNWAPAIDVEDKKDRVVVKAELPGMKKEDVKVSVEENYLIIEGEKKEEEEKEEKGYYRRECSYGSFQRAVSLPSNVDTDNVDASYKDGVLKINLPKNEEEEPPTKEIDIK